MKKEARLRQRQTIISTIREDFSSQDFLEVETPLLVKKTSPDVYIDSVAVKEGFLITSTEYQIKRLIAAGISKVFTLTKNFREGDVGRYHSSEFTMLEWGRAKASLKEIEQDAMRFIWKAFHSLFPNQDSLNFNGYNIVFTTNLWESLTVREAFKEYLKLDDLEDFSLKPLLSASKKVGISLPLHFQDETSLVMSFLLDQLQKHLGKKVPTFLREWPFYLTSSAPINEKDPHVAERSELYIGGIEIANGFPFLRDAQQQRILFEQQLRKRKEIGKTLFENDEKYIEALKELPPGAGMALGIDRLVMVLTEASSLADVQAFTWEEL